MILLQAEILELKANPKANTAGTVIEAQIEQGRGAVATVIVEKGTLKRGDALVSGESYCRVKSMVDAQGNVINSAGPSTAVKILGGLKFLVPAIALIKRRTKKQQSALPMNQRQNVNFQILSKFYKIKRAMQALRLKIYSRLLKIKRRKIYALL